MIVLSCLYGLYLLYTTATTTSVEHVCFGLGEYMFLYNSDNPDVLIVTLSTLQGTQPADDILRGSGGSGVQVAPDEYVVIMSRFRRENSDFRVVEIEFYVKSVDDLTTLVDVTVLFILRNGSDVILSRQVSDLN